MREQLAQLEVWTGLGPSNENKGRSLMREQLAQLEVWTFRDMYLPYVLFIKSAKHKTTQFHQRGVRVGVV